MSNFLNDFKEGRSYGSFNEALEVRIVQREAQPPNLPADFVAVLREFNGNRGVQLAVSNDPQYLQRLAAMALRNMANRLEGR